MTKFEYVQKAINAYRLKLNSRPDGEAIYNPHGPDLGVRFHFDVDQNLAIVDVNIAGFIGAATLRVSPDQIRFGEKTDSVVVSVGISRLENADERQQVLLALTEMNALADEIEQVIKHSSASGAFNDG